MPIILNPPQPPDIGLSDDTEFRIREIKFGDNYSETSPEGINSTTDTVTASWTLPAAQATALRNTLKSSQGSERISYQFPDDDAPRLWRVIRLSRAYPARNGRRTIRATFKEEVL